VHLEQYRHTAIFTYDNYAKLYLERTLGLARLNQLTAGPVHLWRWSNRWFRPQQQEEFSIDVTPAGDVVRFSHVLPENLAGKNLNAADARPIAEAFLIQTMKHDLADLELVESQDNKRPARTDHVFTWKQKNVHLGDGSLRHTECLFRRSRTAPWRKDATVAVVLSLALAAALNKISVILTFALPTFFPPRVDLAPGYLETWSPALAVLFSAIPASVAAVSGLGVLMAILRSGWSRRNWWMWAGSLLFLITLGPPNAHSVRQFLVVWTYGAASLALALWVMASFFRDNVLAYLSSIFCILVAKPMVELLSQSEGMYQRNGIVLALVSAAIIGWLLAPAKSTTLVRSAEAT
jgi:hypothetical protein